MENKQALPCNCYCGNHKLEKADIIAGDAYIHACFAEDCDFLGINSFNFTLCQECFRIMPSQQSREQMMSFALETARNIITQKIKNEESLKKYLYDIGLVLLRIINNYSEENVISNTAQKALKDEFNDIYRYGVKYTEAKIDLKQLGLNKDIVGLTEKDEEKETEYGENTKEWRVKKKEIKLKWFNIHENEGYIGDNKDIIEFIGNMNTEDNCNDITHCISVLRLSFLLDLYYDHFIKEQKVHYWFINIFNKCLMGYDITNLMNDFIHIMDYHHKQKDLEHLNAGDLIEICTDKECVAENRRYDENKEKQYNILNKKHETKEETLYEYMDMLHSYLSHKNGIIKYNNDDIYDLDNKRRIIGSKRCSKHQYNKFTTYMEKKEEKVPLNDDGLSISANASSSNQSDEFSFGEEFYYWPYYNNWGVQYIKTPKYPSLKEELLQNKIYTLSKERLNQYIEKALYQSQCNTAKQIKAAQRGATNEHYEIPFDLPFSMSHLLVLMVYTNNTELQFKFKQFGTRKMNSTDSTHDIRKRNMEIGNWYKLLYESVLFFGEETKPTQLLYHGISVKLYFSEFSPNFLAPISTTTSFTVAQQFADGGTLIALQPSKSRPDRCFSVHWFSNYPEEREFMFVQAYHLYIIDIRECDTTLVTHNNSTYLRAMRLFDETFKGYYFIYGLERELNSTQRVLIKLLTHYLRDIRLSSECVMDDIKKELNESNMSHPHIVSLFDFLLLNEYDSDAVLEDLMDYEKSDADSDTASNIVKCLKFSLSTECVKTLQFWIAEIPQYIDGLFHHLVQSKAQCELFVVKSDFSVLSNSLQGILLEEEKDGAKSVLFGDNDTKVCFLEEYIWSMDQEQFDELKALKTGAKVQSELYSYYLEDIDQTITFKQSMIRSGSSASHLTGLGIELISFPDDKEIECHYSFAVDELKWCLNDSYKILDQNMRKVNVYAFPNSALNRVSSVTIRLAVRYNIA